MCILMWIMPLVLLMTYLSDLSKLWLSSESSALCIHDVKNVVQENFYSMIQSQSGMLSLHLNTFLDFVV